MPSRASRLILLLALVLVVLAAIWGVQRFGLGGGGLMAGPTPRTDSLFATAEADVQEVARMIERGETPSRPELEAIPDINARYGQDITLLFHAIASGNVAAIDALLAAGADTRMPDKSVGSTRDFVHFLGSPGGPLLDLDSINEMIRSYLRHGGDPNVRTLGDVQDTLLSSLAIIRNFEGMNILLEGGADPWAWNLNSGERSGTALSVLAGRGLPENLEWLDGAVDRGHFDTVPPQALRDFLHALSGYAQRGDDLSRAIQALAMRVLKRNPDYVETSETLGTSRIFKEHFNDPGLGEIPWEIIRSEAVR